MFLNGFSLLLLFSGLIVAQQLKPARPPKKGEELFREKPSGAHGGETKERVRAHCVTLLRNRLKLITIDGCLLACYFPDGSFMLRLL